MRTKAETKRYNKVQIYSHSGSIGSNTCSYHDVICDRRSSCMEMYFVEYPKGRGFQIISTIMKDNITFCISIFTKCSTSHICDNSILTKLGTCY